MICQQNVNSGLFNSLDSLDLKSEAEILLSLTDNDIIKDLKLGMMKSRIFNFIKKKESSNFRMWSYKWFLNYIGIDVVNTYSEDAKRSYIKCKVVGVDCGKIREYFKVI